MAYFSSVSTRSVFTVIFSIIFLITTIITAYLGIRHLDFIFCCIAIFAGALFWKACTILEFPMVFTLIVNADFISYDHNGEVTKVEWRDIKNISWQDYEDLTIYIRKHGADQYTVINVFYYRDYKKFVAVLKYYAKKYSVKLDL